MYVLSESRITKVSFAENTFIMSFPMQGCKKIFLILFPWASLFVLYRVGWLRHLMHGAAAKDEYFQQILALARGWWLVVGLFHSQPL